MTYLYPEHLDFEEAYATGQLIAKSDELTEQDIEQLTHDKRVEEADNREEDLASGWTPE